MEDARGTDAANGLFKAWEKFSEDNDYADMFWLTAHDNKRAQRFYEKMGGTPERWVPYSIQF